MWDLSSQTRDQTHVSCIGMQILYHLATREAPENIFCMKWIPLNLLRLILWPRIWSILINVLGGLEKNDVVEERALKCQLNQSSCQYKNLLYVCRLSVYLFYPLLRVQYWNLNLWPCLFLHVFCRSFIRQITCLELCPLDVVTALIL